MISIVVPCYNCIDTLSLCTDSLQNQCCRKLEIILVDDGSTDGTGIACDKLCESDGRFRVIHQENAGLMAAWKQGVIHASGDYIVFVDSDDWIEKDLIGRLHKIIEDTGAEMISYGIMIDYSDGTHTCRDNSVREGFYDRLAIQKEIWPRYFGDQGMGTMAILPSRCNKAVKRELLLRNMELLNDELSIGEDDVTSFALLLDADSLYNIKGYYAYHYCRRTGSMLGNYDRGTVDKFIDVRRELLGIAAKKGYPYSMQIDMNFLENILMVIKKIIADMGYETSLIKKYLQEILKMKAVEDILKNRHLVKRPGKQERIFAYLLHKKMISLCIVLTGLASKIRK